MKHLIICREYSPAPGGGIGTYVAMISRPLAERGETVHIIAQTWKGATDKIEKKIFVRLAFSIATSVNPDILIIDEAWIQGYKHRLSQIPSFF